MWFNQSSIMLRILILSVLTAIAPSMKAQNTESVLPWGDQGNGTYVNPILCADYSDPDVIRVDNKYYMVASDFHFIGMQILESDDMVNWRIVTQVYNRFDLPGWDTNERYAGGSWAPAIRYHDGKFWIYFCTPHEGLFMTQAERPEGPWSPLHMVKAVWHWEDPCPFWDDDGKAYLGRSQHGAGPIIVHKMSADGRSLLDDGVTVYTGPVAEGTKFLKRNGFYYLSIPEGGVGTGWQTVLRAKNIYGPYEKRVVLEQGTTRVNGPHQGAIVDTPQGEWWFYHFQHDGALGRVVHLQPMWWHDDWPIIGVDIDRNGVGEPVAVWTKPNAAANEGVSHMSPLVCNGAEKRHLPQTSDDFENAVLSPQWQWNHNPDNNAWSLTEHKGQLTLHALPAENFFKARNTLTQKVMGYQSVATIAIDVSHMAEGARCGLACMGKTNELLGIANVNGQLQIYRGDGISENILSPLKGKRVFLRISFDMAAKQYRFAYSTDERRYTEIAQPFFVDFGNWKGVRLGIYHYQSSSASPLSSNNNYITLPWVRYESTK
jgi:beta-xylosidase